MATLLFVDDDRDAREIFEALFEGRHRVLLASDVEGGLRLARERRPDAVFVDLGLERTLDGLELVRTLRRDPDTSDIPVAVLTGRPGTEADVLRAGGAAFLLKPVAMADLERLVEGLLAGRA